MIDFTVIEIVIASVSLPFSALSGARPRRIDRRAVARAMPAGRRRRKVDR